MFFPICFAIIGVCAAVCFLMRGSQGAGIGMGVGFISLVIGLLTLVTMAMGFSQFLLHSGLPLAEHLALGTACSTGMVSMWVWHKMFR